MLTVNLKVLLERLNDYTALTLEQSVNLCMTKNSSGSDHRPLAY